MRIPHGLRAALASGGARDADFENTVLLLHGDGTNGAQNNTFIDGSTNNFTITRNGNTTQGSFGPYGDRWSNYFDGSGDYLTLANNTALNMGTGDFTIEFWLNRSGDASGAGNGDIILGKGVNNLVIDTEVNTDKIRFNQYGGAYILTSSTVVVNGSWYHVAITRSGTTCRMFVNGVQEASTTSSANFTSATNLLVGADPVNVNQRFFGYISNLRILKGTALYTAAFTPPSAPLTAITNTSLLTCQSNRFIDNSSNAFAITRNGDVRVTPFSPFAPTAEYDAGTNGGSGYFDPTGDYLSISDSSNLASPGSGDFTLAAWVYLPQAISNALGASAFYHLKNDTGTSTTVFIGEIGSGGAFSLSTGTVLIVGGTAGLVRPGQWNYLVASRVSGTLKTFVNGVEDKSISNSTTYNGSVVQIGAWRYSTSDFSINGYISDLRFVKGSGVTSVTVPTAPLTPITNTSLLLNFTNAGIIDNTMNNVLETVGNAQISTTQKKYGTGALYFDGTGDYLKGVPSNILVMSTGDFTIEFWVYIAVRTSFGYVYASGPQANDIFVSFDTNGNFLRLTNASTVFAVTSTLPLTTWTHIAVVRSSGSSKIYVDGTGGTAVACTIDFTATGPSVGASNVGNSPFNGYIDDLRITKGIARYTGNFTPPAAPFADF